MSFWASFCEILWRCGQTTMMWWKPNLARPVFFEILHELPPHPAWNCRRALQLLMWLPLRTCGAKRWCGMVGFQLGETMWGKGPFLEQLVTSNFFQPSFGSISFIRFLADCHSWPHSVVFAMPTARQISSFFEYKELEYPYSSYIHNDDLAADQIAKQLQVLEEHPEYYQDLPKFQAIRVMCGSRKVFLPSGAGSGSFHMFTKTSDLPNGHKYVGIYRSHRGEDAIVVRTKGDLTYGTQLVRVLASPHRSRGLMNLSFGVGMSGTGPLEVMTYDKTLRCLDAMAQWVEQRVWVENTVIPVYSFVQRSPDQEDAGDDNPLLVPIDPSVDSWCLQSAGSKPSAKTLGVRATSICPNSCCQEACDQNIQEVRCSVDMKALFGFEMASWPLCQLPCMPLIARDRRMKRILNWCVDVLAVHLRFFCLLHARFWI